MEYLVIAVILIIVIAVIAYPLFSGTRSQTAKTPNALDGLIAQRDSAYDALRDLDFDFQMGKLSQSDYAALRDKYMARAALALQQIDALLGADGADERIEQEVARLRERRATAVSTNGDEIERQVTFLRQRKPATVATGSVAQGEIVEQAGRMDGDEIEQQIVRLRASKLHCANCGAPYPSGDRFCAKCGQKL